MKLIKTRTIIFLIGVFFLTALVINTSNVQAIEYGLLGGRPANPDPSIENSAAWFIYNLESGEKKEDAIEIMNLFDDTVDVIIYAADSLHSSSGGFALRQFSEPKDQVGSWVKFYTTNPPEYFTKIFESLDKKIIKLCEKNREDLTEKMIEIEELDKDEKIADEKIDELNNWCQGEESFERSLNSKEHLFVPFVLSVPEDADVGEHTGGILIQRAVAEDTTTQEGSAVKLTTRVGVRIYQTVPGDIIKKLSLESFAVNKNFKEFDLSRFFFMKWFGKGNSKPEDYIVTSKVTNSGNVSVGFDEMIKINNIFFSKGDEEISRSYQALKNDFFISNYSWNNPRIGYFEFSKIIKYEDQGGNEEIIETSSIRKLIMPWREIVVVLIIITLALISYFGRRAYLRKKYNIKNWSKYTVKKGDDINSLADTYEIDWKVLAKVNKIKAPFKLEIDDEILVPSFEDLNDEDSSLDNNDDDTIKKDVGKDEKIVVGGSSIAETLWDEYDKKEIVSDVDSLTEKKKLKNDNDKKEEIISNIESKKVEKEEGLVGNTKQDDEGDEKKMEEYLIKKKTKTLWIYVGVAVAVLLIVIWIAFSIGKSSVKKDMVVISEEAPVVKELVDQQEDANNVTQEEQVDDDIKDDDIIDEDKDKTIDFSETSILVLNGGATVGAAGEMKDVIKESENTIINIEAKNAVGEYENETTIYYQDDFNKEAEKISETLLDKYGKIEIMSMENFPEGEVEDNIVVIIGEK